MRCDLIESLRNVKCDREPFTSDHAACVCRLTNAAADEIERLRAELDRATANATEAQNIVKRYNAAR